MKHYNKIDFAETMQFNTLQSNMYDNAIIYYNYLSELYLNKFTYHGNLNQLELNKIEKIILNHSQCAIVKLYTLINDIRVYDDFYSVVRFDTNRFDYENINPILITIHSNRAVNKLYTIDEFAIISDKRNLNHGRIATAFVIKNYAERLAHIDKTIKMHLNKQNLPVIAEGDKKSHNKVMDYFRSAFSGALHFFTGELLGRTFTLQNVEIELITNELYETKEKILNEFFDMFGISNNKELLKAQYVNEAQLQNKNTIAGYYENLQFIVRLEYINQANIKFRGLNLTLNQLEYDDNKVIDEVY